MFQNLIDKIEYADGKQKSRSVQNRPEGYRMREDAADGVLKVADFATTDGAYELEGKTALHISAENGHTNCLRLLLDQGNDIDVQDDLGNTALHYACQEQHTACVKLLVSAEADMTIKNKNGELALDVAVQAGFSEGGSLISMEMWPVKQKLLLKKRNEVIKKHERRRQVQQMIYGRDVDGLEGGHYCEISELNETRLENCLYYQLLVNKKAHSTVSKVFSGQIQSP